MPMVVGSAQHDTQPPAALLGGIGRCRCFGGGPVGGAGT